MRRVIFVRHGESQANREGRFAGRSDPPLTRLGRRQAVALARRLAREQIDAAYASPLQRVQQTAAIALAGRDVPFHTAAELRELDFGDWDGLTGQQIRERWPEDFQRLADPDDGFRAPNGESLVEGRERVLRFVESLRERHSDQQVCCLTSGSVLQLYLTHVLHMPLGKFWKLAVHNCSLTVVEFRRAGAVVVCANEAAHLARLQRR